MQIAIYTFLPIVLHENYCNNDDKQNLWKPTSTSRCYFVSQLCGIKGDDSEGKVQGKTKVYIKDDKKDDFSKNDGHYYIASSNQGIVCHVLAINSQVFIMQVMDWCIDTYIKFIVPRSYKHWSIPTSLSNRKCMCFCPLFYNMII